MLQNLKKQATHLKTFLPVWYPWPGPVCQRVFNWFSWLQFLIVLIDASNEVTSSVRKDNGAARQGPADLSLHVSGPYQWRDKQQRAQGVQSPYPRSPPTRAVIKFVSRTKRSALFDLPTGQLDNVAYAWCDELQRSPCTFEQLQWWWWGGEGLIAF